VAEVPEGAVVITTADIYRQLLDLTHAVGEVKGAVNALGGRIAELDDHEARLRTLERSRWPLPALAIVLSMLAIVLPLILKGR
jgi:hypothetical protein